MELAMDTKVATAWVDQGEERRLTLEGLNDVDAGRVVDHSVIEAWASCLDAAESEQPQSC